MRHFLTTCLLLCSAIAAGAEITLRETAAVGEGSLVRLSDVAKVTGADANRVARLPLMPTPAPGTQQSLSTAAIRAMLAAQGETATRHQFRGAYTVRVSTPVRQPTPSNGTTDSDWRTTRSGTRSAGSTSFRKRGKFAREANSIESRGTRRLQAVNTRSVEQTVTTAVQAAIDERLGGQPVDPRLMVRGVELTKTALQKLSKTASEALLVEIPETAVLSAGSLTAQIRPRSQVREESFRVVADLVEQPMRVVTTAPMSRGAMIVASAVQLEPIPLEEIDRASSRGYTKLDDVVGKEAQRNLRIGDVLSDNNTAPPVMVRRGEQVFVVSGGGGISVTLQAIAKEDGREGELVSVGMLDRRDEFMARVVGYRRLAVLSAGSGLASSVRTGDLR